MKLLDSNEVSAMGAAARRMEDLTPATRLAMATRAADKALEDWEMAGVRADRDGRGSERPWLEKRSSHLDDLVEQLYVDLSFAPTDNAFVACAQLDALAKAYHRVEDADEWDPYEVEQAKRQVGRILYSVLAYLKRLPDAAAGGSQYENLHLDQRWCFAEDLREFTAHMGSRPRP